MSFGLCLGRLSNSRFRDRLSNSNCFVYFGSFFNCANIFANELCDSSFGDGLDNGCNLFSRCGCLCNGCYNAEIGLAAIGFGDLKGLCDSYLGVHLCGSVLDLDSFGLFRSELNYIRGLPLNVSEIIIEINVVDYGFSLLALALAKLLQEDEECNKENEKDHSADYNEEKRIYLGFLIRGIGCSCGAVAVSAISAGSIGIIGIAGIVGINGRINGSIGIFICGSCDEIFREACCLELNGAIANGESCAELFLYITTNVDKNELRNCVLGDIAIISRKSDGEDICAVIGGRLAVCIKEFNFVCKVNLILNSVYNDFGVVELFCAHGVILAPNGTNYGDTGVGIGVSGVCFGSVGIVGINIALNDGPLEAHVELT